MFFFPASPSIPIGTFGLWPVHIPLFLHGLELAKHKHIMGTTGTGKSKFNAHVAVSLITQHIPCSIIDPHADLTHDILGILQSRGFFNSPQAFEKLWYIEFAR